MIINNEMVSEALDILSSALLERVKDAIQKLGDKETLTRAQVAASMGIDGDGGEWIFTVLDAAGKLPEEIEIKKRIGVRLAEPGVKKAGKPVCKCGAKLAVKAKFCAACGSAINSEVESAA